MPYGGWAVSDHVPWSARSEDRTAAGSGQDSAAESGALPPSVRLSPAADSGASEARRIRTPAAAAPSGGAQPSGAQNNGAQVDGEHVDEDQVDGGCLNKNIQNGDRQRLDANTTCKLATTYSPS